mgnify:CR=1 FL=1
MDVIKEKWEEIIQKLKVEYFLSNISFETWIRPLEVYEIRGNTLYLTVNFKASIEHIQNKYLLPLKVCIAEVTGTEYQIKFIPRDLPREQQRRYLEKTAPVKEKTHKHKEVSPIAEKANLNPKYTFDTFVVGGNNNFAHAASLAVAESPGEVYNPLFLYGGVGLGKTHLMHSIAHYILDREPSKKVLYVTSETFTNDLITAIRNGKTGNDLAMNAFRDKYRNNDVLLIDDVQFIIGKESTQEEFFHTFNHLHNAGKQIVISSDKPPKDMTTLEARLRTRFEWGLIADISVPDYETRMAILYKKIELDQLERYQIPDEVIQYIAMNIKTNIRELEGALNKLVAYENLVQTEITMEIAEKELQNIISPDIPLEVTPQLVVEVVAEHFGITMDQITSKSRSNDVAKPRQIAMYLCKNMTDASLETIGKAVGGRDHSTVVHGIKKVGDDISTDTSVERLVATIRKKINPH